eukprot:CAMPEP_0170481298 /NCGR_PEP_ID=MMETSP0208-20121228/1794_1 /TAXON_ID=197538 /ORGANISM="Strombidium inclinatum, Strain S3" /LENGTH=74 /DNA_ID=CAMNT_0010753975 /DNA_START=1043 /DNA_END=1267 /DNA_ORIENTATION=-
MVEFNPYFRANADKLLKSSLFDKRRDPVLEGECLAPVKMEEDEKGMYDYKNLKPLNLTCDDLQAKIVRATKNSS